MHIVYDIDPLMTFTLSKVHVCLALERDIENWPNLKAFMVTFAMSPSSEVYEARNSKPKII